MLFTVKHEMGILYDTVIGYLSYLIDVIVNSLDFFHIFL